MRANRFSNVASTYDRHADPQRALADSLSIVMPDCNPDKILEIGSGTGILTQLLINTYPVSKIHGIDFLFGPGFWAMAPHAPKMATNTKI